MKGTVLLAPVLLALAACSGEAPSGSTQEARTEQVQPPDAQLPEAPPPNPDGTPDPAIVQKLIDAGAEPDEARWLALTTWASTNPEPGVAHIVLTYPWGDTSRIELRVRRVGASEARPPEILEASVEPGRVSATLRYYVPEEDLQKADAAALLPAPGAGGLDLVGLLIPAAYAQSSGSGGFAEVFQTWLTQTASNEVRDMLIGRTAGAKLGGKISKVLDVTNAGQELYDLSEEAQKLVKELDELRKCAEDNPTGVEWVPGEKEKILRQIDQARTEIIADETVNGVNIVTGVVAGVVHPGLGLAAGPALEWSSNGLKQSIKNRMGEIRRSVSKHCRKGRYVISGCELSGTIDDIDEGPFVASGPTLFHFSGGRSGTWNWSVPGAVGKGPYVITLDGDGKRGKLRVATGVNHIGGHTATTTTWVCDLTATE